MPPVHRLYTSCAHTGFLDFPSYHPCLSSSMKLVAWGRSGISTWVQGQEVASASIGAPQGDTSRQTGGYKVVIVIRFLLLTARNEEVMVSQKIQKVYGRGLPGDAF